MKRAINNAEDVWHKSSKALSRAEQQQAFLKAHSTIQPFWGEVEDISLVSAALLTFGISPPSLDEEFEARGEPVSTEELPDDFLPRIELLRSAVRAGSLTPTTKTSDKHGRLDASATRIRTADFIGWCDSKRLSHNIPNRQTTPANVTATSGQIVADTTLPQAMAATSPTPLQSPFDPLPLNGIAAMFPLAKNDTEETREIWKDFAHNAKKNGLVSARITTGKGKRQSSFDPSLVGDWLVKEGAMDRARVDRILSINLPPRSANLKELFAS